MTVPFFPANWLPTGVQRVGVGICDCFRANGRDVASTLADYRGRDIRSQTRVNLESAIVGVDRVQHVDATRAVGQG
jgi:hypothetical protein